MITEVNETERIECCNLVPKYENDGYIYSLSCFAEHSDTMRGTVPACFERLFLWNIDMGTDLCPEHCLSPQGLLHLQDLHQDPHPHCLSLNLKCLKYHLLTTREKQKDYTYATGLHKRVSH